MILQNDTFDLMNADNKDISLEELADRDWLSVRAVNICEKFGLLTLTQILTFYQKNGSFMKLQNCGKKTEEELTELCEKHKEQKLEAEIKDKENIFTLINELNPLKRSTLNRHIEYLISNLTVRAQNGVKNISQSGSIKEILETIYEPEFHFKKLQNIGDKTVEELQTFKIQISNFLILLRTLQNEELRKEYAKLVVKTTFKDLPENFETEFERVLDPCGRIKLFRLLSLLIESDQLFNRNEKRIFASIYSTPNGSEETLESIATDLKLTRERVRQLKSLLQENIQNYFLFISNFITDDFVNYEVETVSSFKLIDDSFSEKINRNEEVNFNTLFCSIILGLFLKKSHSVLGDDETLNGKKRTARSKRFKCCYIISRNLFDVFEFELFVENINSQLNERITETYALHFEGFLLQFLNEESKHLLKEVIPICETILLNEFDLVVNFDSYLVFQRNTKKPLHEYALEILEANGSVMKVDDISSAINEKYPDLETTEQSVRATLQREKEYFIYFGRSSTYGLKKWESEQEDIKGGTIRDIVEEYLQSTTTPQHISEILKYVQRYRNTNERSVMTNIELEDKNRFQFFDGDFVGLAKRTYGLETLNYKRVIGSHFITKMLAKFNGADIEKVIEYYVNKYGYAPVQVRYLLEKKVTDGYIQITADNKLKV
jgi:hypothetical protein